MCSMEYWFNCLYISLLFFIYVCIFRYYIFCSICSLLVSIFSVLLFLVFKDDYYCFFVCGYILV